MYNAKAKAEIGYDGPIMNDVFDAVLGKKKPNVWEFINNCTYSSLLLPLERASWN